MNHTRKICTVFTLLFLLLALTPQAALAALVFTNRTTADGMGSNDVYSVYVDGSTVYVGHSPLGGLSISTDGGVSFTNYTTADGLGGNAILGVYAIGNMIYVGHWNLDGLSISTDGGASFTIKTIVDGLGSNTVLGVYAIGGSPNTVYAATYGGLSISSNGGASFTNKTTVDGLGSNVVTGVYVVGSTVYATTDSGLSISTNGGASFTNYTTADGLGSNFLWGVYAVGSTVYAATTNGLSISTNGGASFTNRTTADGLGSNTVLGVYAIGGSPNTVYAATGGGLSISTDGGVSFTNYTTADGLGSNTVRSVYVNGGMVYAGTAGGLSIGTEPPTVSDTSLAAAYTPPGPSSFTVTFSEDVSDAGGGANTDDVTNPANYLLVERNDATFDTTSCGGGLQAGDTQVPVDSVTYNGGTFTSTVNINGGVGLPVGNYRLFVCGTTSIVDSLGIPLNGGEDYVFSFTVRSPAPAALPGTGFAPGRITHIPLQPADKAYTSSSLILDIPKLGVNASIVGVPVVNGEWDVAWLGDNAGWLEGTAFPTHAGNTGITAHVWDANNNPGPFANLKKLSYGDVVKIRAWGYVYSYSVRYNYLTTPTNTTPLRHEEYDWVTLLTCERYSPTNDNYRFRRVVRAVLVNVSPE